LIDVVDLLLLLVTLLPSGWFGLLTSSVTYLVLFPPTNHSRPTNQPTNQPTPTNQSEQPTNGQTNTPTNQSEQPTNQPIRTTN
jgi:hypothetical protein